MFDDYYKPRMGFQTPIFQDEINWSDEMDLNSWNDYTNWGTRGFPVSNGIAIGNDGKPVFVFKLPPKKDKKILLLHGWFADAKSKAWSLEWRGYDVFRPELSNWFLSSAIKVAQEEYDKCKPDVVIGSSRGGAVAMSIDTKDTPLILMAPAWKQFATTNKIKSNSVIIHSPDDEIIPVEDSIELAKKNKVPILRVGKSHPLNDYEAREGLEVALDFLLKQGDYAEKKKD